MPSTSLLVAPNEQLTLKRKRGIAKAGASALADLPFHHTRKRTIEHKFLGRLDDAMIKNLSAFFRRVVS